MPLDLKEYNLLKDTADRKRREADKAQGAFDNALADLKKTYEVKSMEEAKVLLAELEKKAEKAEAAFDAEFETFKKEHGDVLKP